MSPSSDTNPSFPTTRWELIRSMSQGLDIEQNEGWNEFIRIYRPVLVSQLQRKGIIQSEAEDLVQGFLLKLWKSEDFAKKLSPEISRLRVYLSTGLKNWWYDECRKKFSQKRGSGIIDLSLDQVLSEQVASDSIAIEQFDQEWALALVRHASSRLREEYASRDKASFFDAGLSLLDEFDEQLREARRQQFAMERNTFTVALKRLRERLIQRVREEVAATLIEPSEKEIRSEVSYLMGALSSAGGLSMAFSIEEQES